MTKQLLYGDVESVWKYLNENFEPKTEASEVRSRNVSTQSLLKYIINNSE